MPKLNMCAKFNIKSPPFDFKVAINSLTWGARLPNISDLS